MKRIYNIPNDNNTSFRKGATICTWPSTEQFEVDILEYLDSPPNTAWIRLTTHKDYKLVVPLDWITINWN